MKRIIKKLEAQDIWNIIDEIQNTSGTNDKKDILEAYRHEELYKYLRYVYDEVHYTYGKSKLPEIPQIMNLDDDDINLEELYALVEDMNSGELKGNASDEAMIDYCVSKPAYYTDLLFYIVKRNIKAGINAKGINEVFGRVIPIAPYMRCEQESYMKKRIKYNTINEHGQIDNHGALAQTKADGSFLNVVISPKHDDVECTTRYGRESQSCKFLNSLSSIAEINKLDQRYVIHGELLVKNVDGTIMDRAKGNGMINTFNKRKQTEAVLQEKIDNSKTNKAMQRAIEVLNINIKTWQFIERNLVFEVWDILPESLWLDLYCPETTIHRFKKLEKLVDSYNWWRDQIDLDIGNCELRLIDYKIVYNDEQAMEFYQDQLDKGLEGMVIKNLDAPWEHDINRNGIIKLKDFKENDFIITGYDMADPDSDFAGGIGSLIMESSEGKIKVNVSGMKRHDRGLERVDENDSSKGLRVIDGFDFDQFTGKVAAVKYNEMSKNKQCEYSLFLPNVLEIRDASDKSFPDDFDKIKKTAKFKG